MADEPNANFDAKDFASGQAIASFLDEAFSAGDTGKIAHALGVVAPAIGMAIVAQQAGLPREQLEETLSPDADLTIGTTLTIMQALGVMGAIQHRVQPHAGEDMKNRI